MITTLHPFELSSLVTRLNFEIHENIIEAFRDTSGPACLFSWNKPGEDERMEICCDTKMVEIRSVVVPVNTTNATGHAISLSGAKLEVVGAWRIDGNHYWLRNHCFGEAGTLVLSLPSFEPEHIKEAATLLTKMIGEYFDTQLETC